MAKSRSVLENKRINFPQFSSLQDLWLKSLPVLQHGEELEWAAQGGGGITAPVGVQEKAGCGTEGHGLASMVGMV